MADLRVKLTQEQLRKLAALNPLCACGCPLVSRFEWTPPPGHLVCIGSGTNIKRPLRDVVLAKVCDAAIDLAEQNGEAEAARDRREAEQERLYAEAMERRRARG